MGLFDGIKGKKEVFEAVLGSISGNKRAVSNITENVSVKIEEHSENIVDTMSHSSVNVSEPLHEIHVSDEEAQSAGMNSVNIKQQFFDKQAEDNIFIDIEEHITTHPNSDVLDVKTEPLEEVSLVVEKDSLEQDTEIDNSDMVNIEESVKMNVSPAKIPEVSIKEPEVMIEKSEVLAKKTEASAVIDNPSAAKESEINVIKLGEINGVRFSDVYITPDKKTYIWGGKTNAGLVNVEFKDIAEFLQAIEGAYAGSRSYLLKYKGRNYRVERTIAMGGVQFCARKMPIEVPALNTLGLPEGVYKHLISLAGESGLILLAGATGSGKSTTIAALMKEYLSLKGGYAFTIEDPVELPLDGVYVTPNGELGLCKQTEPPDGLWEEGIKSALRSKPRYIYLGEIRSPDIASEALRAATSGHLVLSSIHANNVSEAINSLVKYAASSGISEAMAYELVAGGLLGVVHQILSGAPKKAHVTTIFANPDTSGGCQVRGMIRNGKLNLSTLIEQQKILLRDRKPLFRNI